jgi:hypothetical protein
MKKKKEGAIYEVWTSLEVGTKNGNLKPPYTQLIIATGLTGPI